MRFGQCSQWEKRKKPLGRGGEELFRPIQCIVVDSTTEHTVKIDVWWDCSSLSHKCQKGSFQLGRAACSEVKNPLGIPESSWAFWATLLYDWWFCKLELLTKSGSIHLEVLSRNLDPSLPWHSYQVSFENQVLSHYWALAEIKHLHHEGVVTLWPIFILEITNSTTSAGLPNQMEMVYSRKW